MGALPARDRNDREARLEALFRRHYPDVAAYVRRRAELDLVEDVVAETFLVAWRRLDEIPQEARPWLLGVARKTLSTQRRSSARRRSLLTRLESEQRGASSSPELGEELGIAAALMRLPEKDREAITLIAWEGLRPREAALVLGQSPVAFRVRFHRARKRLRARLGVQADASDGSPGLTAREIPLTEGGSER